MINKRENDNMMNSFDYRYLESNLTEETLFRKRYNVTNNRSYAHLLLNTFPTKKLSNEIRTMHRDRELYISEWLLFRLVALSKYEYDRYEDISKDNNFKLNKYSIDNINHEENFKLYCLCFVIKTISVFISSNHIFNTKDRKIQDKCIINLFYDMVRKLNCIEILDDIVNKLIDKTDAVEDFYNEVIEYSILISLMTVPLSNPYETDMKQYLINYIKYDTRTIKEYNMVAYKSYNKHYNAYVKINNFKDNVALDMSYFNLKDTFDNSIFNFNLENFELFTLNEIARDLVEFYDGYRDEKFINALLTVFNSKYKYTGKVYHGTRNDRSNINRSIDESIKNILMVTFHHQKMLKSLVNFQNLIIMILIMNGLLITVL